MKSGLQTNLGQHLVLTPQLRQAIHLLQLPILELQAEIASMVEANPLLEWDESAPEVQAQAADSPSSEAETDTRDEPSASEDSLDIEYNDDGEVSFASSGEGGDGERPEQSTGADSLQDHLLWQLHLSHCSEREQRIALAIIEGIDEDGYLRESLEDIGKGLAAECSVSDDELRCGLRRVQAMDPLGVGARDLSECLQLQLQALDADTPHRDLALTLCEQMLEQLPKAGVQGIARQLQVNCADAEAALALLRSMDPRPGARFGEMPSDTWVVPDAFISRQQGVWRVSLANSTLSRLGIQQTYAQMAASAAGEDGKYLRGQLQEAKWLLKNLQSRDETLMRVVQHLVDAQAGFLEFGPMALRPLTLRELASELGVHESTISRTVARKHVHTPRGTIALRDFFASGVGMGEEGETSSSAIQEIIRSLVAEENPSKPLSDAKLVKALQERGIDVARRTVAKYREAIGIGSSQERVRKI